MVIDFCDRMDKLHPVAEERFLRKSMLVDAGSLAGVDGGDASETSGIVKAACLWFYYIGLGWGSAH
jgi:hypothetical protein